MRFLETDKLITSHASISPSFTYATGENYFNQNVYGIELKKDISLVQILGILNSKLSDFYIRSTSSMINGGYFLYKTDYISQLPVIVEEKSDLISLTNKALELNSQLSNYNIKFIKYLVQSCKIKKLSKKLQNWHELDFGEFIKELNKAIKANNKLREKAALIDLGEKEGELKECTPFEIVPTLTKKDEFEWLDLFEENKQKAQALQTQINQTDKEIDAMVYELYGLTEDEIAIVENS